TTTGSSSISSSSASAIQSVTTNSATNVTSTSATLNGTVNPGGENVYYIFSYYKSGTSGSPKYTAWKSAGSGSDNVSVSANISDLSFGTTYNYQISAYSYATNKYVYGAIKSFTTAGSSSSSSSSSVSTSATLTPKTGSAYNVTSTSARLTGTINPKGENVSVYFQYRKSSESSDLTKTTTTMSTGSISSDFKADIGISSLSPGTTYIYRFYAYSYTSGKTVSGELMSFTTTGSSSISSSSASAIQSVTTNSATNVTSTSATAYPLTVSKAGTGTGLVSAPGISCPSDCFENYPSGTTITLIAAPAAGTVFTGWMGCNASNGTVCSVLMSSSKSIIANFVKP
ncbi:MAG: hypothetical protein HW401_734, partial [Parcubacteria group bacterium]|nr:hypothetical protein [Parcubacteria group bacterium]